MVAFCVNRVIRQQASLGAYRRKGSKVSDLVIMPPVSQQAAAQFEAELAV